MNIKNDFQDYIKTFLILLFCFAVFFTLQYFRVITVFGVTPNFILLFFLVFPFLRFRFLFFIFCGALYALFTFLYSPFWIVSSISLILAVSLIYGMRRFLTGNPSVDFFFSIACATFLFYAISFLALHAGSYQSDLAILFPDFFKIILIELGSNVILGIIAWGGLKKMGIRFR